MVSGQVQAQFGDLLQKLQKLQAPGQQQLAPSPQNNAAPVSGQASTGASQRKNTGLLPSKQWCGQQVGALGNLKVDTGLIASEFAVPELEALQDRFFEALKRDKITRTFPSARFFQASFETKKVRALYDTFLAFPEPDTLAALIKVSRDPDQQERADALMALSFLHLQAPEISVNKDRWFELYQKALSGGDHFTALVFRARMNAYGEYGPKNLSQAVGDLVTAGGLKSQYSSGDGIRKEFDIQNYLLIHTATIKDIFNNEPKFPGRQAWQGPAQMGMQIEQAQAAFERQLPNTRIGKMYREADRLNTESIEIGNSIIKSTQSGNQTTGQIQSIESLRASRQGEKPVFEDISPEVQAAQMKVISANASLDDQQKKMLSQAHEKRLAAQGVISQTYGELLNMMMSSMSGDMARMAAPLPALRQANNSLIQSCIITAKWEQAMRAKDVPKPDMKKAESAVEDLNNKYKD